MKRILGGCIAGVMAIGIASGVPSERARARSSADARPNVLVVVTDDQRLQTMAVMRRTRAWLDDGGADFTRAYVTTPRCCPSRASIFSGRYAHNHGVLTNELGSELDTDVTMQAHLDGAGYHTAFVGKYLNGIPVTVNPPHFDRFAVREKTRFYDSFWNVQGEVVFEPAYDTDAIRRHAFRYLRGFERNDDDPWFMYLAPLGPHIPATPHRRHRRAPVPTLVDTPAMHEDDLSDKPDFVRNATPETSMKVRQLIRRQQRSLLAIDELMQALRERLADLREGRRTLVIFTSDNGYLWRDHGPTTGKNLPYIPSVQVPFYVRWPGRVAPGTEDHRLAANIDIAPTVLNAAGIEPASPMDGRSLLDTSWTRDRLLLENWHASYPPWSGLISHGYQYVEYRMEGGGVLYEYYDLVADPWQLSNPFGDDDATNDPPTAALASQLASDFSCAGTSQEPGGPPPCP